MLAIQKVPVDVGHGERRSHHVVGCSVVVAQTEATQFHTPPFVGEKQEICVGLSSTDEVNRFDCDKGKFGLDGRSVVSGRES